MPEEDPHASTAKDSWFAAYLKGNLMLPQTYDGGALLLAEAVLRESPIDRERLLRADHMTPSQLARVRRVMQAVHQRRRIAAGDQPHIQATMELARAEELTRSRPHFVTDERLSYIWRRFRDHAIEVLDCLVSEAGEKAPTLAHKMVEGLRAPECRELTHRYRSLFDPRQRHQEADVYRSVAMLSEILDRVGSHVHRSMPDVAASFMRRAFGRDVG